jgi:hypothetical protein
MSTSAELQELSEIRELPLSTPLDETAWQTWVTNGRARERRGSAVRVNATKWISIVALLAASGPWLHFGPYEALVRFIVAAASIILMVQAFRTKRYVFAAAFGALALLYNPVAPVFNLSGQWQRVLVISSVVPFVASLIWRTAGKPADND